MRTPFVILLLAIAAAALWRELNRKLSAEFIITNCQIWTADDKVPWADSMAIRKGKILRVGSLSHVQEVAGKETEVVDLNGKFVVPGFIDSHVHFISGGLQLVRLDLQEVQSRLEFQRKVERAALALDDDAWLLGFGWSNEHWGGEWPDSSWIDDVSASRPVWLSRIDGHMGLANKVALDRCHLYGVKDDPVGGSIIRNEDGVPTGLLVDAAMLLITSCIPKPSVEQRREAFSRASQHAVSNGVTSVVDFGSYFPGVSSQEAWDDFDEVYTWSDALGNTTVRAVLFFPLETWTRVAALVREKGRILSHWLFIHGVKAFADGSLGSSTALFHEPYADDPNNFGLRVANLDWLSESVNAASEAGLQVAVHAIGDAAVDDLLNIYSGIVSKRPHQALRLRVEHAQHLSPEAPSRFRESSIIASMQPEHLLEDASYAVKKLGEERSKRSYGMRALLGNGTVLALGSDWPVAAINPLGGIQAAVKRTPKGWKTPWIPEESIEVAEALKGYTISAAYAAGLDNLVGSLKPGKLADFVVLSESPFLDGAGLQVIATYVGGLEAFNQEENLTRLTSV